MMDAGRRFPAEVVVQRAGGLIENLLVLCGNALSHDSGTGATQYALPVECVTQSGLVYSGHVVVVGNSNTQKLQRTKEVQAMLTGKKNVSSVQASPYTIEWVEGSEGMEDIVHLHVVQSVRVGAGTTGMVTLTALQSHIQEMHLPAAWSGGCLHADVSPSLFTWDVDSDRSIATLHRKAKSLQAGAQTDMARLAGLLRDAAQAGADMGNAVQAAQASAQSERTACSALRAELESCTASLATSRNDLLARFLVYVNGKKGEIRALQIERDRFKAEKEKLEGANQQLRVRLAAVQRDYDDVVRGSGGAGVGAGAGAGAGASTGTGKGRAGAGAAGKRKGRKVVPDEDDDIMGAGAGAGAGLDGRAAKEDEEGEQGGGEVVDMEEVDSMQTGGESDLGEGGDEDGMDGEPFPDGERDDEDEEDAYGGDSALQALSQSGMSQGSTGYGGYGGQRAGKAGAGAGAAAGKASSAYAKGSTGASSAQDRAAAAAARLLAPSTSSRAGAAGAGVGSAGAGAGAGDGRRAAPHAQAAIKDHAIPAPQPPAQGGQEEEEEDNYL